MAPVSELVENDISELKSFVLEAWRLAGSSALGWTGATDENIAEIASDSFLRGFLHNPHLKVFVSKTEGKIVGFCAIRKIDDASLELAGIVVRQDHLGKGIGTDLFQKARKEAVKSGFTTMIVKTESNNERALAFYRSKGFVEQEQVIEEVNGVKVNLTTLKLNLTEK
jgi:ribosomal protein S18 acetylase RimI-like enzyme